METWAVVVIIIVSIFVGFMAGIGLMAGCNVSASADKHIEGE